MPPNLVFPPAAYAQLQPHQLLPQPSSKHLQPQFVIQQQQQQPPQQQQQPQQSRPALQTQSHPQLASIPPSLALQPGPEAHAMPLGPVTSTLPLQCPAANLHKPGSTQQCHLPTPDVGPHNGYPEGLSHTPQRRFQHASAVILQLQPASPAVSKPVPRSRAQTGRYSSDNPAAPMWMCFWVGGLSVEVLPEYFKKEKGPLPNLGLAESYCPCLLPKLHRNRGSVHKCRGNSREGRLCPVP